MKTTLEWTTGKVMFLYFCGVLLGSNLMLLVQAIVTGGSVVGTLLGVLMSVMLPVLPIAAAYSHGRRYAPSERRAA
jgi:hypothetical protein